MNPERFQDCGLLIYKEDQPVQSGGSGAGCSATVLYGHLLNQMKKGVYKRILVVATGALLSPLSYQQKESIPCIAHAVSIEMEVNEEGGKKMLAMFFWAFVVGGYFVSLVNCYLM